MEIRELVEEVLGAHLLHHVGREAGLDALLARAAHGVIELQLSTAVGLDLTQAVADDEEVELAGRVLFGSRSRATGRVVEALVGSG